MLAVSRAVGDYYLKPFVSGQPDLTCHKRTAADRFLVLASDGLWDEVSNKEVAKILLNSENAQAGAQELVRLAYAKGSEDNISVVVVPMAAAEREKASALPRSEEEEDAAKPAKKRRR